MKKILSIIICAILAFSCLAMSVSAADAMDSAMLPFKLNAPANVSLLRLPDEGDSPTTHAFSYSMDNDMLKFFEQFNEAEDKEAFLSEYDLTDIYVNMQMDWAIDDVNDEVSGWHYTEFWDFNEDLQSMGYDSEGNIRHSEWDIVDCGMDYQTVNTVWVLRAVPDDDRWNGNPDTKTPGVKEQLKPEQYTYHDDNLYIDWTEHTAYARARFVLVGMRIGNDRWEVLDYSDWSETASAGKDAVKYEPLTAKDLPAPVITDLHMTDKEFNGNPVVAFTLSVPDELAAMASRVASAGGSIRVWTYARVAGDSEWTEMGNTDTDIRTGELECALLHLVSDARPQIPKDTPIELRCRYLCTQRELDDIYSEYSQIISFGTEQISSDTPAVTEAESVAAGEEGNQEKAKCRVCGICPIQPLGICLFIWIAIIILVIVIIVIIASKSKKESEKTE